jgi:hypothetical protein
MVMEAVACKVRNEDQKAEEAARKKAWHSTKNKDNFSNLDKHR